MRASTCTPGRSRPALVLSACGALAALGLAAEGRADGPAATRWTAATPDAMAEAALARAARGGDDALAGLVVAAALDERATFGKVRAGLATLAAGGGPLGNEARLLGRVLAPEPAPEPWVDLGTRAYDVAPDPDGLVRSFAVLGPFRDPGDGLGRREGPEAPAERWSNGAAAYSWGAYSVTWRRALPESATARGLPLDLYVSPRAETCSYLASKVTLPAGTGTVVAHVASTGTVRVIWDGADVGLGEEVHPKLVLDRLAVRLHAEPGPHLFALKVCSYSMPDEGRVRVRFADERGAPLPLACSSDLAGLEPVPARTRAEARETPLGRALAAGEVEGTGAALVAAVLRTLGGADDLRSERAAGLVDRVVRDTASSADTLAMAGWIAPEGATRSGWLELARERARAAGDAETEAFTTRRLVAAYLATGQSDWAQAEMAAGPLAQAGDAEASLLRALGSAALGASGLGDAAFADLLDLETRLGEATPVGVLAELANRAHGRPAVRHRLRRRLADVAVDARGPRYVASFALEGAAALERGARASLASQTSARDLAELGALLLEAGRLGGASDLYAAATHFAPNQSAGFRGLATAELARAAGAGAAPRSEPESVQASARAWLERASELEPGDPALKAELAFRAARAGAERAPGPDEQYLVLPEVFLARGRARPARQGEVFDRQLHWVRVVTYHADGRVSQLMHYAREIVIEPRNEGERYEPLVSESAQTELVRARLHRQDGTVVAPEEQGAGGSGPPYVRWPELHRGDVVEVVVRSWTPGPVGRHGDPPFYFVDYVGSTDTHPVLYNEVVVVAPPGAPLAIDVLHGKPDRRFEHETNGRHVTHYVWDDPPTVPDEPLAPSPSETLPVVVGSTFPGWAAFRKWYAAAVAGFTEPDAEVRRIAAELTRGKTTRDEKLRAVFDFVADDIRYVNYVSGEWWLPNRPQELLLRRQGDCDDKALLLITLLKVLGIEATEVLVQTRYTGQPALLGSTTAAIPLFDHGIAYLPGVDGKPGVWLDATSPESRIGPLPSMDARAVALFATEGPAEIVATPASSPAEHGVDASWTIALTASGRADVTAEERHAGDAAFALRTHLKEEAARAQWLEQYLASGWLPAVRLRPDGCRSDDARPDDPCHARPAIAFTPYLPGGFSSLGYAVSSEGFARREGEELAVPISPLGSLTSELAPLPSRRLPVVLPPQIAPSHDVRTLTIVAPPGFVFAELPPDGDEDGGELGRAHLAFAPAAGKNAVVVKRSIELDRSTIPPEKYPAWRAFLQRVDGLMRRVVRLVPERAAPGAGGKR